MDFYLTADVHALDWKLPVMVSHGRLRRRTFFPEATEPWVCDSRGFTELSQHGKWTISAREYAAALRMYAEEIGHLRWASPQDWMCEPWILEKTGLTIPEHQQRTVESVLLLRQLARGVHIIPVLQGWAIDDYLACIDLYAAHGVDLRTEPVVGLGSVCRRQATTEIDAIVQTIAPMGIRLHGFGVKTEGLHRYGPLLESADSFAWSYGARKRGGRCVHGLVTWETNCPQWAREWRENILAKLGPARPGPARYRPVQMELDLFPVA